MPVTMYLELLVLENQGSFFAAGAGVRRSMTAIRSERLLHSNPMYFESRVVEQRACPDERAGNYLAFRSLISTTSLVT